MSDLPPPIQDSHKIKSMKFEDLYISEDGNYYFLDHHGIPCSKPLGYIGPEPRVEIQTMLHKLKEKGKGKYEFLLEHDGIRYRVATIVSDAELKTFVLRKGLKDVPELETFEGLNGLRESLINTGNYPGLIIATGPTGSGKTTFSASLLKTFLTNFGGVAVTIEDPPELALGGQYPKGYCYQTELPESQFEEGLKSTLRFRPKYIFFGEIRSQSAAQAAIRAGLSGHTVLATVHGGSIPAALLNLASMIAPHGRTDHVWRSLAETVNVVSCMQRSRNRPAPEAKSLIISAVQNPEGVRSKIRSGLLEQLENDVDQLRNRTSRR